MVPANHQSPQSDIICDMPLLGWWQAPWRSAASQALLIFGVLQPLWHKFFACDNSTVYHIIFFRDWNRPLHGRCWLG